MGLVTADMATRTLSSQNQFEDRILAMASIQAVQVPGDLLTGFAVLKLGTRVKVDLHAGSRRMGGATLAIESVENENQERHARAAVAAPASVGQPVQGWKLLVQNEAHA
jgi:hypothetical protein